MSDLRRTFRRSFPGWPGSRRKTSGTCGPFSWLGQTKWRVSNGALEILIDKFSKEPLESLLLQAHRQLRHPEDRLSIGLILCKTRSKVIAEYALRNVSTPVGVTRYTTKLMESLPAELKDSLPSTKLIEAELESQDRKRRSVETEHDADLKADCALRKVRRGYS